MALKNSNQRQKGSGKTTRPLQSYARFGAVTALFVTAPIWLADEVILSLRPLGQLDTSIAVWIAVFALPLALLLVASGEPVLRSRHKHVGDFALLDSELGSRMSTLAAVSTIVEYISTYALLAATGGFFIISAFPRLYDYQLVFSIFMAIAVVFSTTLGKRRYPKIATGIVVGTLTLLIILIIGFIGASPYLLTTGSQDLVDVSQEITSRTSTAPRILVSLFSALVTVMTPVIMIRHFATDLSIYSPQRARSATTAMVATTFAFGVVTIGVFSNVADIDSGAFLLREYAVFNALRIINIPTVILGIFAAFLLAATLVSMRVILDDARIVAAELTHFSIFPLHVARFFNLTGANITLLLIGTIGLLSYSNGKFTTIIPIVVLSGIISLTLTRLATLLYWRKQLRYEGHSHERKTMKKAKLVALGGVVVSFIMLLAFLAADMKTGTWAAVALIGSFYMFFFLVRSHYLYYGGDAIEEPVAEPLMPGRVHHMVIAPNLGPAVQRAIHWVKATRPHSMEIIHVDRGGDDAQVQIERWRKLALNVELTLIETSSIRVHQAVLEHIRRIRQDNPNRLINVVIPHYVLNSIWKNRFYNAEIRYLRRALEKESGVMVTVIPWSEEVNTKLKLERENA
ncbi:hypothetical protein NXS08_02860 [Gleimia sp. 6138-11-ORH1]|uniref:hypothetical protein n=1 Tax=Gleimia sp. 6138-11-ORH1 TaxID=2973937 RepID=UPI002169426E|nr:hypothetical protein [Gleimia sp. 6138-11-ORH1]MCS4484428.1 hypothetical protein [Gleimia sp. 6138-11-ORH1]